MEDSNSLQHVYFFLVERGSYRKQEQDPLPQTVPYASSQPGTMQSQFDEKATSVQLQHKSPGLDDLTLPVSATPELASGSSLPVDLTWRGKSITIAPTKASRTKDCSPRSSISSHVVGFNPRASAFAPYILPTDHVTVEGGTAEPGLPQYYTLRDSDGKGKGLFASCFIPRGTLIIREKPLVTSNNHLIHVLREYNTLSSTNKTIYDELHFHHPEHLDLESASRFCMMDQKHACLDSSRFDRLVEDQVRVMGIFAANNFATVDEDHLALFATISRINHSCVSNAYHFYNTHENCMTIYASHDIVQGAELLVNYIQGVSTYQVRAQRIEQLRSKYGFTCQCPACSDRTNGSNDRRTMLNVVMWGLQMYIDHGPGKPSDPYNYHPSTPKMALAQVEDALGFFKAESIINVELLKALRIASAISLQLGNLEQALQYTTFEMEISNDLVGPATYQLQTMGYGPATAWAASIEQMLVAEQYGEDGMDRSSKKKSKSKAKKNVMSSTHDAQAHVTAAKQQAHAREEAENVQIRKELKAQKKRLNKQKTKEQKRAQAEARPLQHDNEEKDSIGSGKEVRR